VSAAASVYECLFNHPVTSERRGIIAALNAAEVAAVANPPPETEDGPPALEREAAARGGDARQSAKAGIVPSDVGSFDKHRSGMDREIHMRSRIHLRVSLAPDHELAPQGVALRFIAWPPVHLLGAEFRSCPGFRCIRLEQWRRLR
jgi:hypothetical protein